MTCVVKYFGELRVRLYDNDENAAYMHDYRERNKGTGKNMM